jgi:predicted DNA-binding transcriptional regulator AlpA
MTIRREFPLGMKEIAALLGVKQSAVWQWEKNRKLPPEDGWISGRKGWWRATILAWDAAGRPRRSAPLAEAGVTEVCPECSSYHDGGPCEW